MDKTFFLISIFHSVFINIKDVKIFKIVIFTSYSIQYNDLFLQLLSQFLFYVRYNSKVARIATSELPVDQRLHYIFIMAPFQVSALDCYGALTTIHRKRFYRNFALINLTLLLAKLITFPFPCFSSIFSCLFLYNNNSKG